MLSADVTPMAPLSPPHTTAIAPYPALESGVAAVTSAAPHLVLPPSHTDRTTVMHLLSPIHSMTMSNPGDAAVHDTSPTHAAPSPGPLTVQPPLGPEAEDMVHELLAMNTLAMERGKCAALDEAIVLLTEAYEKLNSETAAQRIPDAQLLDQLQATTLNNMGVTECHRGQPRHAISHFEAARQLEERWNVASPSLALNSCAAYNALGMYDKATAAALEAIDLLRTLELQRTRAARLAASGDHHPAHGASTSPDRSHDAGTTLSRNICLLASGTSPTRAASRSGKPPSGATSTEAAQRTQAETDLLIAAAHPAVADSQNRALWGAAWHNLAVAQLNTARPTRRPGHGTTPTAATGRAQLEHTNTLVLFRNAMRATQELLGPQHPMSCAVVATFRAARRALRRCGAFKQHHTLLTDPDVALDARDAMAAEADVDPDPGRTRHATVRRRQKQLSITFRGTVTAGAAVVERVDPTPYPGATLDGMPARVQLHRRTVRTTPGRVALTRRVVPVSEAVTTEKKETSAPHPTSSVSCAAAPVPSRPTPPLLPALHSRARNAVRVPRRTRPVDAVATTPPGPWQRNTSGDPPHDELAATQRPSAARTQPRLLLLADPPAPAGPTLRTTYYALQPPPPPNVRDGDVATESIAQAADDDAAVRTGVEKLGGGTQSRDDVATPRRGIATQLARRETEVSFDARSTTETNGTGAQHPFFNAMWVAADVGYVRHGKRELGRPGYYIANVLNVDDAGALSHETPSPQPVLIYDSSEASSDTTTTSEGS